MSSASRHAAWTQRLVRQTLAVPDAGGAYTSAEDALVDLVHRTLQRGSDRPIQAALSQLWANNQDEAADRLRFWADCCASTRDDLVMQPTDAAEAEHLEATIFLLPIIGLLPPQAVWPATIVDNALTSITQSFRRHGLIGEGPSVMIAPYWYTTHDLPTTWSGRRQWLDSGVHAVIHRGQNFFPPSHAETPSSPAPSLQLRWIVGIVIEADDQLSWLSADPEDFDIDDEAWDAWESTLVQALDPLFPPDTTYWILHPGEWTTTVTEGILYYHRTALGLQLHTFPPTASVYVQQTEDDTWEIQWTHDGHEQHYPWTIPDDPEQSLLAIVATLRLSSVDSITIQAGSTSPRD